MEKKAVSERARLFFLQVTFIFSFARVKVYNSHVSLFCSEASMGSNRNISLSAGLSYKGGSGYLTYILHRIGGSALFIFFTVYILSLLGLESMQALMGNWIFQTFMLTFGLFHAINGLRISILDLSPKLMDHYRTAINIEWVAYVLVAGFALFVVFRNAFGG
jgi:succinate dehydrogenase/fumarate reductase cytochrome b subunit